MLRNEIVQNLASGLTVPDDLTDAEYATLYAAARGGVMLALLNLNEERQLDELSERITPEVVADAQRGGLWLYQMRSGWYADMGDAHPYPLSEHGPARNWLRNYFERKPQ